MVASAGQIAAQLGAVQLTAPTPSANPGVGSNIAAILNSRPAPAPVNIQALENNSAANVNNILSGLNTAPIYNPNAPNTAMQILSGIGNSQNQAPSDNSAWDAFAQNMPMGTAPVASSGSSWNWLYNTLNDTLGQIGGMTRTALDKTINAGKQDFSKNEPWYQKINDFLNDASPANTIGGTIADAIKAGAQNQWNNWTDGKLGIQDIPGFGFLHGMSNSYTTGDQLNQDAGINSLIDNSLLKNSSLQNGYGTYVNQFLHDTGNTNNNPLTRWLQGIGDIGKAATLGTIGELNQGLASLPDWVNNVPFLDMMHKGAQGVMSANPNGNQGVKSLAGLITSAVTDPLTYADGIGLADKAGELASLSKMGELQKTLGVEGKFNSSNEFLNALDSKLQTEANANTLLAQNARAKTLGQSMGIDPAMINRPQDLLTHAQTMLQQKYPNLPTVVSKGVQKIQDDLNNTGQMFQKNAALKLKSAQDAIEAARAEAYNSNLNKVGFSIPGTNRGVPVASVPETVLGVKNPFYRSEATLRNDYTHLAQNAINDAAGNDGAKVAQLQDTIKQYYGVNDLKNLTKSQYTDMVDKLGQFKNMESKPLPNAKVTEQMVQKSMPNEIFNIKTKEARPVENVTYTKTLPKDILDQLDPRVANKVAPLLHGLGDVNEIRKLAPEAIKMYGDFAKKIMQTAKGKTLHDVQAAFQHAADVVKNASHTGLITKEPDIVYQELQRTVEMLKGNPDFQAALKDSQFAKNVENFKNSPYTKLADTKTQIAHVLDTKSPFNPRSLKTDNSFVNSMANHIADANSFRVGNTAKYSQALNQIDKFIRKNKVSSQDMMDSIYHLEGKAPDRLGANWQASAKSQQLSGLIKPILDRLGSEEQKAGVLNQLRENYFPHVVNKNATEADLQASKEFQDRHPELKGQSEQNKFNQERASFPTLADQQNYLDKLSAQMAKTTDHTELESLQNEFNRTRDLFQTNIPQALTQRIREGVRAQSMKALHGELQKYGMLKSNPKDVPSSDMVKLDKSQARKLGLGEGQHYINQDVLKGMQRVDEIFTSEGMNKFVRQVNAFTDIFRSGVTSFKLSHYRNNVIGNLINNMAAGVKYSEYQAARKLIQRMRSGSMTAADQKLIQAAYDHNVISGGFVSDLTAHGGMHFSDPTALEKIAKVIGNNRFAKAVRQKGELVDDVARLANFMNGIKKFGTASRAAKQVRTYLFNYNESTNSDRTVRSVIPFWNWTKRNVPLQMKNLLDKPAIALNFERAKQAADANAPGADWQKDTGFKLPFLPYYTSVPSPTDDLKQFMHPVQFASGLTPAIRIPMELATNRDIYTGKPIVYGGKKDNATLDYVNYLAKNFGIVGDINNAIQTATGTNNKTLPGVIDNYLNPQSVINQGRATVK